MYLVDKDEIVISRTVLPGQGIINSNEVCFFLEWCESKLSFKLQASLGFFPTNYKLERQSLASKREKKPNTIVLSLIIRKREVFSCLIAIIKI